MRVDPASARHHGETDRMTAEDACQAPIRDGWYAGALAGQVGRTPLQTWLLGQPIVLFRKPSQEIVALVDRCPHRHAPLSRGTVIGEAIQCRYHGFQFEATGRCIKVPGEKTVPAALQVQALPTLEAFGLVWLWPGDPTRADPGLLPTFPWADDPTFSTRHADITVNAPSALIVDNLMDLTHVHFVHRLLGAENLVHESEPMQTWEAGDHVYFRRDLKGGKYADSGVHLEISGEFIPPSMVITSSVPRRASGEEVPEASTTRVLHCLTPSHAQSTRYFVVRCWTHLRKPQEITAVHHQIDVTLAEDKDIIEAQYQNRQLTGAIVPEVLIRADRAAVLARRMYVRVLQRERVATSQRGTDVTR